MKNFLVFFTEKEGTSPLMHLLDNFKEIDIVHQVNNQGWEPLEEHEVGPLSIWKLKTLLRYIYGGHNMSIDKLNALYTKRAKLPIKAFHRLKSNGLKMRLIPHNYTYSIANTGFHMWDNLWEKQLQEKYPQRFRQAVIDAIRKYNIVVFLAVRQDVLRWALSKYHGDGTGRPGHMQFRLATGELDREQIGKIQVDCDRLESIMRACEAKHRQYHKLYQELTGLGIEVFPLKYEEFLEDRHVYFHRLGRCLDISWTRDDIDQALSGGSYVHKVHGNDIADFVINHEEVMEKFGDRFVAWN